MYHNKVFTFIKIISCILCLAVGTVLTAQQPANNTARDTSRKNVVNVDFADVFEFIKTRSTTYQKLIGDVELRQDSIFMYCDSAIIRDDVYVTAMGNVLIQQGDSLSVFSDSLLYNGLLKTADLYGEVILLSGNQKLFTDSLHYNLKTKIATYNSGALLTNDTTQLRSKTGYFYVATNEVFFKNDVIVTNEDFTLKADTLKYNTDERTVYFLGPTLITTKENGKIYCEDGFYDIKNKVAEFRQNAQYKKEKQRATGDIIRYDGGTDTYELIREASFVDGDRRASGDTIRYEDKNDKYYIFGNARYRENEQDIQADAIIYNAKSKTYTTRGRSFVADPPQLLEADRIDFSDDQGLGIAEGNVIWRDTAQNITILADMIDYNKAENFIKTKGSRPWLITIVEGDSLFLRSDTLVSYTVEDTIAKDTHRLLLAYNDVRIFKKNLQAVSDSMTYSTGDSLFRFFNDPVIWSDTSQFTADTVHIQMADNQIDRIFLYDNAFIINSPDEVFFNQIKGKDITAFFQEKNLRRMRVEGNAESVYFALDEQDAYVGMNETICSEMLLFFGNNQVEEIKFFAQPKATLTPIQKVSGQSWKMEGFNWIVDRRPKSKADL